MRENYRPSALPTSLPSLTVPGMDQATLGERASEWVARRVGSWPFIIGQSCLLVTWVVCNSIPGLPHWDPYPFILMNLVLSLQAAYTAPMIMMAANRAQDADRYVQKSSYYVSAQTDIDVQELALLIARQSEQIEQLRVMLEERAT